MLKKFKTWLQDLAFIGLYFLIAAAVFFAVVMSTLASFGFRWGPGA